MAPGTLSSDQPGNAIAAVNGAATFSGVKYSQTGTIYLFASSPPLSSAFSTAVALSVTNTTAVEAAASPVANFNLDPINDTLAERFNVLKFKVADKGSDLTPTLIDQVTIAIAGTAGAAASDIAWAGCIKPGSQTPWPQPQAAPSPTRLLPLARRPTATRPQPLILSPTAPPSNTRSPST
jgi:hypothetical protein